VEEAVYVAPVLAPELLLLVAAELQDHKDMAGKVAATQVFSMGQHLKPLHF
jgi:hypothetical protein